MKPLVVASNMFNEIDQVQEWYDNMREIADAGILIVDTGSTDGSREFFEERANSYLKYVVDDIILREGYGPARNHLRLLSRQFFPRAHWMVYLDFDERMEKEDFHNLRFLKDYLNEAYDIVALPRLNRLSRDNDLTKYDFRINPDYQARMTRLDAPVQYIRKIHEQIVGGRIFAELTNPKIHHHHRSTSKEKRDYIGKVCVMLHDADNEFKHTVPDHHKADHYRELLKKEGLHGK